MTPEQGWTPRYSFTGKRHAGEPQPFMPIHAAQYHLALRPKGNGVCIQGFWPQGPKGINPLYAERASPLDVNALPEALRAKLDKNWSSPSLSSNEALWQHEWARHGHRSPFHTNPQAFFEKAMELYEQRLGGKHLIQFYYSVGGCKIVPYDTNFTRLPPFQNLLNQPMLLEHTESFRLAEAAKAKNGSCCIS